MALKAIIDHPEFRRVVLEARPEGVYVLGFRPGEQWPSRDHLQDDWAMAKRGALHQYNVTEEMWHEIPDTGIMG